jgi:hypothetical protein
MSQSPLSPPARLRRAHLDPAAYFEGYVGGRATVVMSIGSVSPPGPSPRKAWRLLAAAAPRALPSAGTAPVGLAPPHPPPNPPLASRGLGAPPSSLPHPRRATPSGAAPRGAPRP